MGHRLAIMAVIGQSLLNVVLVLGLVTWVQFARVVRGATLSTVNVRGT